MKIVRAKLLCLKGARGTLIIWEEKFIARAYKKKFADVLLGTVTVPKYKIDYDDSDNKPDEALMKIIEMNVVAYGELINCMDTSEESGKTAFRLVRKTRNAEFPHGNARQAYLNLKGKYSPTSEVDKGILLRQFHSAELSPGASPDNFITKMEGIRSALSDMGVTYEEDVFLHQIINGLGPEYLELGQSLARLINNKNDPLTLEMLRNKLDTYDKKRNKAGSKISGKKRQENAFVGFTKQYKNKCKKCGERGHKSSDCRKMDKKPKRNLMVHVTTVV